MINRKRLGAQLIISAMVGAVITGMFTMGVSRFLKVTYNRSDAVMETMGAMHYAENEAEKLRAVKYSDINIGTTDKINIEGTKFYKEISVKETPGTDYSLKTCDVKIYDGLTSAEPKVKFIVERTSPNPYLYKTIGVNEDASMTQKAISEAIDSAVRQALPSGTVVSWYGYSIPDGWLLCNGSNGTPDLRGRFIVGAGAGSGYSLNDKGGEATHILTIEEMPKHTHTLRAHNGQQVGFGLRDTADHDYNAHWTIEDVWGNQYGLMYNDYAGESNEHENRPPYYALYYIMKK